MSSMLRDRHHINAIADEARSRQPQIQKNTDYGFVFSSDIDDWQYAYWRKVLIQKSRRKTNGAE